MKKNLGFAFFFLICILVAVSCLTNSEQASNVNPEPEGFKDFEDKVNAIVSEIQPVEVRKDTIDLISYSGQVPDGEGSFDFQRAVNQAIKELSARGGGTLHFRHTLSPGTWVKLTETYRMRGPLIFHNNVELLFDHSVRLFFEFNPASYLPNGEGVLRRYEGTTIYSYSPQIYAFDNKNIKISKAWGNGALPVIDGDGENWVAWSRKVREEMEFVDSMAYHDFVRAANNADTPLRERVFIDPKKHPYRPSMMEFLFCEDVEVSGVKLKNPPFWVVHPVFSKNLWFHDMIFDAQNVNNDGFDPESSDNILIENIIFDNHDDNVVAKAGRDVEGRKGVDVTGTELEGFESPYINDNRLGGPTTDIVFRNSTIQGHYAFAAGSEMSGGVDGAYVYNLSAPVKVKSLAFIKSSRRRGGTVKNIYIKDVNVNRSDMAIAIIPNYDGDTTAPHPPKFSNLHFRNISVKETGSSLRIYGWEDVLTEDVFVDELHIEKAEHGFQYNFVKGISIKNSTINGQSIDGEYFKSEKDELPPEQN